VSADEALALEDVRHTFGRTRALDGASCRLRRGTVHALLGENGAGKSTLMKVAFGMLSPDAGTLRIAGTPTRLRSSRDAIARGIGMVHQHFMLVPALTVAENVALGGRGRFDPAQTSARIATLGERTGLVLDPRARVADLSVGEQQRLEIVKALAHDARILILDEPTAVLPAAEADELLRWLRRFADEGNAVMLITHKLREAFRIADDVTVMRRGRTVRTGARTELDEGEVVRALVGEMDVPTPPARRSVREDAPIVLALEGATVVDPTGVTRLHPTSLTVRAGEGLGVLGVEGAGQHALLRLLAGRLAPTAGRVMRPPIVGFIPEDRLEDALIPDLPLTDNLLLADAGRLTGRVDHAAARHETAEILRTADVRAAGPDARAATLSGGNQQKFVVARENRRATAALVAENPTRGLDLRAAASVLAGITTDEAMQERAIVVHSADIDEVLAVATRVVVCFAGVVREVPWPADRSDRTPFTRAMTGAA